MLTKLTFNSQQSIKRQVITFLVAGISLMTILISLLTALSVYKQSTTLMIDNATQISEGLAQRSTFAVLSGSSENIEDAIAQVLGFQSVLAVKIINSDGSIFSKKEKKHINYNAPFKQIDSSQLISQTSQFWLIQSPVISSENNLDDEFDLFDNNTKATKDTIAYVQLAYSKQNLQESQQQISSIIIGLGIASVIIISIVLHFGLNHLFSPLRTLANTMDQAKNSGEHILATVDGAKEIKRMAKAYNNMMTVLDKQDDALKQHKQQLEKQVEIRTRELVTARDAALTASRHKSEFMANITHELRTPIQSIIGYSELINEELEIEGHFELIDDLDKIEKNASRLLKLINSILDLAKAEAGKMEAVNQKFTMDELLNNINDVITPLSQAKNNQFTLCDNSNLLYLNLDKEKLEQILLNLLSNACKFTKQGQISLAIEKDEKYLYFIVKDDGIGLSQEQQSFIFDEFRQVEGSESRHFGGTGLGLAISKRFADLIRAQITIQSELGEGAVFTLRLELY